MRFVLDIVPEIRPSLDLCVIAKTHPSEFLNAGKVKKEVEPGVYLLPKQVCCLFLPEQYVLLLTYWQTLKLPKLYVNVFHKDTRLCTMLLVDPGMFLFLYHTSHLITDHFINILEMQNESFTSFLHGMKYISPLLTQTVY
jgi:large subunit ribosomal protein L35